MKGLVVFYSLEGNTRLIAETIAQETGAELLELIPDKEIPKAGFGKYFYGGKSVLFHEAPHLKNDFPDLSQYDTLFLGTPIWAGSFASPVAAFLETQKPQGKKIGLFACHRGGGAAKCFRDFKKALPDCQFLGEVNFVDPLVHDPETNRKKTIEWLHSLKLD